MSTAIVGTGLDTTADEPQPRWRSRRYDTHVVFWVVMLATAGTALVRNRFLFTHAMYPFGDTALNALLVDRAEHFEQLVGNYSRVGFHHPGPALFYVLAAGQGILHDLLHIVPSQYNGQLIAGILYSATFIGLTVVSLYRLTRSRAASAIAFGVLLVFATQHQMLGNLWFPYLYLAPFLLFVVAAGGVAAGRTSELPLLVLGGGFLVHGHISFVEFVAVSTVVAVGLWVFLHRRLWRAELATHRRGVLGSGVLLGLFLLPIVLNTVLHYPGQWPLYRKYVDYGYHEPRTAGEVIKFTAHYWGSMVFPVWLSIAAAVAAVLLTATERDPMRRRGYFALYGLVALQIPLMLVYVQRGVDSLVANHTYVGYFFMTMPALVLAAAAGQLWARIADEAGRGWLAERHWRWLTPVALAGAAAVSAYLVVGAMTSPRLRMNPVSHSEYPDLVAMLRADPARHGRPIEYVPDGTGAWVSTAGLAVETQRVGQRWCLRSTGPIWTTLFTTAYTCNSPADRWQVHVTIGHVPGDARVIWSGRLANSRATVYEPIAEMRGPARPHP